MDIALLFSSVHNGTTPPIFNQLDYKLELDDKDKIASLVSQFPTLIKDDTDFKLITRVLHHLQTLEQYQKWIEHPIYLNEFKDKYDNKYIQARTSIKGADGNTKWISAYIGSLNDYPKGIKDSKAYEKAKPLIRKKLKKYFNLF
jgi:hypothetical protein